MSKSGMNFQVFSAGGHLGNDNDNGNGGSNNHLMPNGVQSNTDYAGQSPDEPDVIDTGGNGKKMLPPLAVRKNNTPKNTADATKHRPVANSDNDEKLLPVSAKQD